MSEVVQAGGAPKPVGHYPHARRVGDLLFLSGIGPREPATNAIPDGIEAQTHAVFANVRAVLDASGARWEDLADVTVYLTDMAGDFAGYNRVWAEYFPDAATAPCRTTLGITALPTPISIELKCIAHLPERR
ncbi:2-aminomuconate deaminase [Pseudoxanthomonas japonensis]|uniref:RidA family protein n=1 Tax=Pseudoxanthomonas japonensis TaxID=69284 RepID=UPI002855C88A|nr:RidA family protein [Pseudoxanthomonas japonensis]MDR7070251.1 2-aminomuconate deaminase [Pseudoxanthomonas japonensis]